jgi:membrane-associated phospholipid phosphatase
VTAAPALAALVLLAASSARAQEDQLTSNLPVDLAVTAGALAVWGGTALAKESLAPAACRVCAVPAIDAWARDRLLWDDPAPARSAFNLLGYAILPASGVALTLAGARGRGESWSQGFTDVLLVTEAVAISGSVSQLVKLAVGRQRPYVHYANHAEADRRPEDDDNLSFYSGHTALAFSLVASTCTVAYLRGSRAAPWVLGIGLGAATTVGWLAVASDRHYLTDALAGAVLGSAIGWGVPWLLHRSTGTTGAAPGGVAGRGATTPLPLGVAYTF